MIINPFTQEVLNHGKGKHNQKSHGRSGGGSSKGGGDVQSQSKKVKVSELKKGDRILGSKDEQLQIDMIKITQGPGAGGRFKTVQLSVADPGKSSLTKGQSLPAVELSVTRELDVITKD